LYDDAEYFRQRGMNISLKPQSDKRGMAIVDGYTPTMLQAMRTLFPDHPSQPTDRPVPRGYATPPLVQDSEGRTMVADIEMRRPDGSFDYLDDCERLNADGFPSFTGWHCHAGYQSIVVSEPGGIIYRCFSCHATPLGSLDTGFQLFPESR